MSTPSEELNEISQHHPTVTGPPGGVYTIEPEKVQDLIMVRSILNFPSAERAWGSPAGIMIISSFLTT